MRRGRGWGTLAGTIGPAVPEEWRHGRPRALRSNPAAAHRGEQPTQSRAKEARTGRGQSRAAGTSARQAAASLLCLAQRPRPAATSLKLATFVTSTCARKPKAPARFGPTHRSMLPSCELEPRRGENRAGGRPHRPDVVRPIEAEASICVLGGHNDSRVAVSIPSATVRLSPSPVDAHWTWLARVQSVAHLRT
jgi:hypothetical protein